MKKPTHVLCQYRGTHAFFIVPPAWRHLPTHKAVSMIEAGMRFGLLKRCKTRFDAWGVDSGGASFEDLQAALDVVSAA